MLGTPHHLVSAEKLKRFLDEHKISDAELLDFQQRENEI
jgi:hypothetical protein